MSHGLEVTIFLYCVVNICYVLWRMKFDYTISEAKTHYEHEASILRGNYETVKREVLLLDEINKQLLKKLGEK